MRKVVKAAQIKKMTRGTLVHVVNNEPPHGETGYFLIQLGKKKALRHGDRIVEIKDTEGKHYEVDI